MSTLPSQLFRLLHLASPALPIGAFHFSQGLEYAVEAGWVRDEASALGWIGGLADGTLGTLDLPVLARLHAGFRAVDDTVVTNWNARLRASRETAESRAEDLHMGSALLKVLHEIGVTPTTILPLQCTYATAFAFACANWKVPVAESLQAYAWAWTETQVIAAVKLVPLGQSAGQRILHGMIERLPGIVDRALMLPQSQIGIASVAQGMASARHESQYTRLFRS